MNRIYGGFNNEKLYNLIPFTGYVSVPVRASDTDEAIVIAFEKAILEEHIEEWELHREVNRGNVSYALLNQVQIFED